VGLLHKSILAGVALIALAVPSLASNTPAGDAMQALAKSMAIDGKCNFLSRADHDKLSIFLARAELSLAQKESVTAAKSALAAGRSAAAGTTCAETDRADITSIYEGAKMASVRKPVLPAPAVSPAEPVPEPQVAAAPPVKVEVPVAIAEPASVAEAEPQPKVVAMVEPVKPPVMMKPAPLAKVKKVAIMAVVAPKLVKKSVVVKPAKLAGLATYASLTQKYYVERRCHTMTFKAVSALYADVVNLHKNSLKNFGRGPVAAAMHSAEADAKAKSCS
jgi:hypothetical protein